MNCIEFEAAIERAVEQRTPLSSAMLEHAGGCAACQQLCDRYLVLESAITAWRQPEAPAGLVDSVMGYLNWPDRLDEILPAAEQVSSTRRAFSGTRSRSRRSQGWAIVGMSACLLIAAIVLIRANRHGGMDLASKAKGRWNVADRINEPVDLPRTLTAVLSDLKSEYSGIAVETSNTARDLVSAIPRPATTAVLPETDEFMLSAAPGEMARMWKPIGNQVGSALGFLLQAVPSEVPSG